MQFAENIYKESIKCNFFKPALFNTIASWEGYFLSLITVSMPFNLR